MSKVNDSNLSWFKKKLGMVEVAKLLVGDHTAIHCSAFFSIMNCPKPAKGGFPIDQSVIYCGIGSQGKHFVVKKPAKNHGSIESPVLRESAVCR